jgi:hypothetical protein
LNVIRCNRRGSQWVIHTSLLYYCVEQLGKVEMWGAFSPHLQSVTAESESGLRCSWPCVPDMHKHMGSTLTVLHGKNFLIVAYCCRKLRRNLKNSKRVDMWARTSSCIVGPRCLYLHGASCGQQLATCILCLASTASNFCIGHIKHEVNLVVGLLLIWAVLCDADNVFY